MGETDPGSAARDKAKARLEDATRRLRLHATQLEEHRAAAAKARTRTVQAAQRRRPALVLTAVQAIAVAALGVTGLFAGMPAWGWVVLAGVGLLCVLQGVIARADDRAGWPPAAAGCTCALVIVAGLAALGVLPGWVGLVAAVAAVCTAAPIVADRFFDIDLFAAVKQG